MNIFVFLSSLSLIQVASSFNFLVFCPLFGHSHTTFFAKIADTLSDAGHNVTFFTPTIVRKFSKFNYVKSTNHVVHLEPSEKLAQYGNLMEDVDISRFWGDDASMLEQFPMVKLLNGMFLELATVLGKNLNLLDDLKARKFDVVIFESFVHSAYPLIDYLEIEKFIPSTSIVFDPSLLNSIGEPRMPSAVPLPLSKFADKMTLMERLTNTVFPQLFHALLPKCEFKSFRPPYSVIDTRAQEALSSFIFTNSNPYIDFPRPTIEKNVQIGGISVDIERLKALKVDKEWDTVLTARPRTVLISFGSVIFSKDMPQDNKKSLAFSMSKFPEVTFIWKYESDDTESFASGIENIHFSKWVPQTALLADSRLSAFFTHAGLGSISEVSYLGKPAIICPLFADQMRNAKMLARHNGSIEISKFDLSNSNKIIDALRRILFNNAYKNSAENLALQLKNQPVKPSDLLLRHAEFVAKFGRLPSLDPYSRHMSFIEYFLIDVAAILTSFTLLVVFLLFQLTKKLIHCISIIASSAKQKVH